MGYDTTAWTTAGNTLTIGGTTLYKEFGVHDFSPTAGFHFLLASQPVPYNSSTYTGHASFGGNGTDPVTSLDLSAADSATLTNLVMLGMWYITDNIYIDSVRVFAVSDEASSAESIGFHVYSYDIDLGTGSAAGDLTNGTLIAHIGTDIEGIKNTVKSDTLTIDSNSISSGKAVFVFGEAVDGTEDIGAKCIIKYHLT